MSNVVKLAKSISIKRADDPEFPWNEEGSERDPMMFEERITPPNGAKQEEQPLVDVLRYQLNRVMMAIRGDYETLKNVPGALTKVPSDVLEAFFQIWNDVQALQMSDSVESNANSVAIKFLNLVADIKYFGIKTIISDKPINVSQIVDVISKVVKESVSSFYEGKFTPKIIFAEELSNASNAIASAMSRANIS